MARKHVRYTPEFRRQLVGLYRGGRWLKELSAEFGCSTWSIRQWDKQGARDTGKAARPGRQQPEARRAGDRGLDSTSSLGLR
jgi:transposase-like protein